MRNEELVPPSCIAEPPRIHLAHVSKANQTHHEVFHGARIPFEGEKGSVVVAWRESNVFKYRRRRMEGKKEVEDIHDH